MKNFYIKLSFYTFFAILALVELRYGSSFNKKSNHHCEKEELKMSATLVPYFEQFVADCEEHGIKYDHAYCLKHFYFGHSNSIQGNTDFYSNEICINDNLEGDSIGMRFVIYHEFGHWFGLEHSKGIMKPSYNTGDDKEWAQENWEELKTDYFNKLKNIN